MASLSNFLLLAVVSLALGLFKQGITAEYFQCFVPLRIYLYLMRHNTSSLSKPLFNFCQFAEFG